MNNHAGCGSVLLLIGFLLVLLAFVTPMLQIRVYPIG